jgi:hypothetical protein
MGTKSAVLNARHAGAHAACTRSETLALVHKTPPMTTEQLITHGLIDHIDEPIASIRETVGAR